MSKTAKIGLGIAAALIAFIFYSTIGLDQVSCEVCVTFEGREACRSASGTTREEAIQTATNTACSLVAGGRDSMIACTGQITPKRITCGN